MPEDHLVPLSKGNIQPFSCVWDSHQKKDITSKSCTRLFFPNNQSPLPAAAKGLAPSYARISLLNNKAPPERCCSCRTPLSHSPFPSWDTQDAASTLPAPCAREDQPEALHLVARVRPAPCIDPMPLQSSNFLAVHPAQ